MLDDNCEYPYDNKTRPDLQRSYTPCLYVPMDPQYLMLLCWHEAGCLPVQCYPRCIPKHGLLPVSFVFTSVDMSLELRGHPDLTNYDDLDIVDDIVDERRPEQEYHDV
jgi:hypothetical protein